MQFPQRILLLISKIALDQIIPPERTDQLVDEARNLLRAINAWRFGTSDPEPATVTLDETSLAAKLARLSTKQKEDFSFLNQNLEKRFEEEATKETLTEGQIEKIVGAELPGKSGTYVLWLSNDILPSASGAGRYVHFSWDTARDGRIGFKVRDFISGTLFHEPDSKIDKDDRSWDEVKSTQKTAAEIWAAAGRRLRTIEANGLGQALGSAKKTGTRKGWRVALADLK